MKSHILFPRKTKKNIINLSSAEFAHRVIKVSPCHAKSIKMPRPLLIFGQSDFLIHIF